VLCVGSLALSLLPTTQTLNVSSDLTEAWLKNGQTAFSDVDNKFSSLFNNFRQYFMAELQGFYPTIPLKSSKVLEFCWFSNGMI